MAPVSSGHSIRDLSVAEVSACLLSALENAHSHLEPRMVALESMMIEDKCVDLAQFGVARRSLAHANLTRARIALEACSHLVSVSSGEDVEALRELHQREVEHFQMISKHIQRWTTQGVQDHWHGYCEATRKVLERNRELISIEKKLLLPLLRQVH